MSGTLLSRFYPLQTFFSLFFLFYLLRNDYMNLDSRLHLFTGCGCDPHFLCIFAFRFLFTLNYFPTWSEFNSGRLPLCGCLLTGALNPCCRVEGHSVLFLFMFLNATWPLDPLDPFPSRPLGYSFNPGFDQDGWKRKSLFHLVNG